LFHSHLAVRHLVRELEIKGRPARRLAVPEWLKTLLCDASEDFNPSTDSSRAGYECRLTEQGWEASLFLGTSEIIGGARDGQLQPTGFQLDLLSLMKRFDRIDVLDWNAMPARGDSAADGSFVTLEGVACGEPLRLHVLATPIDGTAPGLRRHQDGRVELT
jgi:hypothetical protein